MNKIFLILFFAFPFSLIGQNIEEAIADINHQLEILEQKKRRLIAEKEGLKLQFVQAKLKENGLPKLEARETLVEHSAMSLVYSEEHEQSKWVAHIITSDITKGNVGRSNDFREDEKVSTGTAVEKDYFLTSTLPDGTIEYDGFGYDRGHLAPSADFRWSKKALSESYLYSNMSPQAPDFNRIGWGKLENMMRGYMYHNTDAMLYVVTGPVLEEDLPVIERSINKPSIPKQFFKVVIDLKNKRGIGFLMPNQRISYPVESFAKSIDEIEEITGIDFYHALDDVLEDKLEKMNDVSPWLHQSSEEDVLPIHPPSLPPNHFNTIQANRYKGRDKTISVCGTVVHTKLSKKGNAMIYLDKSLRDPVFIVFIRKEDLTNFSYDPVNDLKGATIKVSHSVGRLGETPTMFISNEKQIELYNEKK